MDFFERQHQAQQKTKWLVFYLVLAVILIMAAVYLAVLLVVGLKPTLGSKISWWQPDLFFYAAAGTLLVVICGSAQKILQLTQGGPAVATMLGGRPLQAQADQPREKQLLNVVEEMAIAAGLPVPAIYVLDEEGGINAFAAGFSPGDAVVGVTRGCLKHLSRDELQGVIAHEFSHILHGDMRLNLRLIGLLNGILCLALMGRLLTRLRGRRNAKLVALGLTLLLIGSIGLFFGRLIKSAIARQREFLADAAAVQFTRNPEGLAGALKKIGGLSSRLHAENAEEASHLYFADGMAKAWMPLLSTHPPLLERIRALDPNFNGQFPDLQDAGPSAQFVEELAAAELVAAKPVAISATPEHVVAQAGQFSKHHLAHAAALIASLPPLVAQASREPAGAAGLVYALLLSQDEPIRQAQLQTLQTSADAAAYQETLQLIPATRDLAAQAKLLLIDRSLPALRCLSRQQYQGFSQNVQALIEADRQIDLFEYTLQSILRRHLAAVFEQASPTAVKFPDLQPVAHECAVVLSALAQVGQEEPAQIEAAFRQGADHLNLYHVNLKLLEAAECNLPQIDAALERLNQVAPLQKRNVLYACAQTVAADGAIQEKEAELIRAIADSLECPIPPLLESFQSQ